MKSWETFYLVRWPRYWLPGSIRNRQSARSVKSGIQTHAQLNQVPSRLQKLAKFLDNSITLPGGYRIGWDAIIGLVPGVGDFIGTLLSTYILAEGVKMGAPISVIIRMLINVLIESIVGAVPVLGDVFDAVFKANLRNVALLENYNKRADRVTTGSRMLVAVVVVIAIVTGLVIVGVAWSLAAWVLGSIF